MALTTPTAGDAILVFAYRAGNVTPPTVPTGYVTIDASGANVNSAVLAFKYSDGTETTTGTWTNATSIEAVVYRGVDPAYPIGGWSLGTAPSATIAFNTFTLWTTDNTSWVIGFAAHRTATNLNQAPTNMSLVTSATNIGVSDTNATATSWSTQTITVNANSGWQSYAVELRTPLAVDTKPSPDYLVQHVCGSNVGGGQFESVINVWLPNLSKTGNTIVVSVGHWSSLTASVTDDKGNTYTSQVTGLDGTNGYQVKMFTAIAATAGVQHITVTVNNSGTGATVVEAAEFYGITSVDVTAGTSIVDPRTIATGSMTTTTANDLIYHVAMNEGPFLSGGFQAGLKRIVKDSGLVLLAADVTDGVMAQYGIKAVAGAINPTMHADLGSNPTTTNSYVTAAIAFKVSGGTGTAGSGKRVVRVQGCNYFLNNGSTKVPLQFPASGNLLVHTWIGFNHTGGVPVALSSIADGAGNTWASTGAAVANGGGDAEIFYALSPTVYPNLTVTLTLAAQQEQSNGLLLDIADEGKTWAFDNDATATGNQVVTGNITSVSVTPTNTDGIVIGIIGIFLNTITALTGAGAFSDAMTYPEAVGSKNFYEDNGVGHVFNSSASAISFVWSTQNNPSGVGQWAARAAAFKAASAASTFVPYQNYYQPIVTQ